MALKVSEFDYTMARRLIADEDVELIARALARANRPVRRLSGQAAALGLAALIVVLGAAIVLAFIATGDHAAALGILKGLGGSIGIILLWAWLFLG